MSAVDLEANVHGAITRVLRGLTRESLRRARYGGARRVLSNTDLWLLGFIDQHQHVRPTDLAAWQDVDKSTITMQVKRLLAVGHVERVADEGDRRASNISLTDSGRAALAETHEYGRGMLEAILSGWSDEEKADLGRSLAHFADSIEEYLSGPAKLPQR